MKCVLYARVSTDKQAEKELSIPAQLRAMREYADRRGWSVVAEYIEPGASAKTTNRPALQQLLNDVRTSAEPINAIIVHKIDRLARNVYDHATIRAMLKRQSIALASVVENVDESVSGQLVENIMASIAQFYSANLAEEVRKGMRQKVIGGGWPHMVPRGYRKTKRGERRSEIEIDPQDGPLIRKAFELYAAGWYSIKAVALLLADEGLRCRSGRAIAPQYLRDLLSNPFYVGRLRWKDVEAQGTHEPLVSQELFDQVRDVMRKRFTDPRAKGGTNGFPLRGIARCAFCRGHMTAGWQRSGSSSRRFGYYRCARRMYDRTRCDASKGCPIEKAHVALKDVCATLRLAPQFVESVLGEVRKLLKDRADAARTQAMSLAVKRTKLREKERRLTEVFLAGDLVSATYREMSSQIRTELSAVSTEIERASVDPSMIFEGVGSILRRAETVGSIDDQLSDGRHAELLRTVFKSVVLDENGVVGVELWPQFEPLLNQATSKNASLVAVELLEKTSGTVPMNRNKTRA